MVRRGVLVADRGFSSTQDYSLDVDSAGNAVLAFRDDRASGTQITAAKVDATGALLWGAAGVQLTNTTSFVAAPKVAGTSDGKVIVAWTQGADVRAMKLDSLGAPLWATETVISPATNNFAASDMHASDSGGVVIAMQLSGGFTQPRHLYAQKLDSNGALLWGASHVAVFDGGSLQFGNFPKFVADGAGGAVFGWYSSSPSLECYVQRLTSSGVELFPHNGVAASTSAALLRVNPDVAFDPATQATFLVYREQNAAQSQSGVSAQKFDATGNRQWTPGGQQVVAPGANDIGDLNCLAVAGGCMGFWTAATGFAQDRVFGARLDSAGAIVVAPFDLSSTPATKFRVQAALSTLGFAILAWRDEGAGNPDILAQNALPDGTLGAVATAIVRNGTGINPLCYTSLTRPAIGTDWASAVAHATTDPVTVMFVGLVATNGPINPGIGELLVDISGPVSSNIVISTGTTDTHTLAVPASLDLVGLAFPTQALTVDAGLAVHLCNAIDITLGL